MCASKVHQLLGLRHTRTSLPTEDQYNSRGGISRDSRHRVEKRVQTNARTRELVEVYSSHARSIIRLSRTPCRRALAERLPIAHWSLRAASS